MKMTPPINPRIPMTLQHGYTVCHSVPKINTVPVPVPLTLILEAPWWEGLPRQSQAKRGGEGKILIERERKDNFGKLLMTKLLIPRHQVTLSQCSDFFL